MNNQKNVKVACAVTVSVFAVLMMIYGNQLTSNLNTSNDKNQPVMNVGSQMVEMIVPDHLELLLRKGNLQDSALQNLEQIIIVDSKYSDADIYLYEIDQTGIWTQYGEIMSGHIGLNGSSEDKKEGDRKTPKGLYSMSLAFGIDNNIATELPFRVITTESYWVNDPKSKYYNQWVEGTKDKDWNSAEHLSDYSKQYEYAIVIDYNTNPTIAGNGSAIFIHCGNKATNGCIATCRENIIQILTWLGDDKNTKILII